VVIRRSFAGMAQWRVAETLANRVSARFVRQPVSWHRRQSDGQLVARAGVDVDTSIAAMAPIPFATSTVLMVIVAAIWLLLTDLVMGTVAVAVFPVLIVVNVMYQHRVDRHFDEAQQALGDFSGAVHESFEAVQLVKAYGAGARETGRLSTMASRIRDARVHAVHLRGTFEALLEVIPSMTNIGIVVLGAARVQSGDVTVGELSGFIYMFTLLVFPLRIIGYALSELPHSYAGYHRVKATIDEPLDPDPTTSIGIATGPYAVELRDVSFTYPGESTPVVDRAEARIRYGTVTAIVGATGAGKTTLVDLVGRAPPGDVRPGPARSRRPRRRVPGGVPVRRHRPRQRRRRARPRRPSRHRRTGLGGARPGRAPTVRPRPPRRARHRWSASAASRSRAASASGSRWPGRWPADRRCWCSTTPRRRSTRRPSSRCSPTSAAALSDTTVVMVASRPSTVVARRRRAVRRPGRIVDHGTHDRLMRDVGPYRDLIEAFEADRAAPAGGAT
jgi:ATP-binding cassette, subfamily B, bacterial